MKTEWFDELLNPGSQYRGAPFWAWNGTLEPEELRRQIRLMHRMGLGGFFMHSRVGLNTVYMSEAWFECIEACVDEAEKLDMQAWLYDEDRYPSGAAGGRVTRKPEYRARKLVMTEAAGRKDLAPVEHVLAYFTAEKDPSGALLSFRAIPEAGLPARGPILRFHVQTDAPDSWYNGQTYLDTLNPEAVREFMRVTHKAYAKRLGGKLGRRVPGIFTDEPYYGQVCGTFEGRTSTSWTGRLPEVFRKRYGYDLLERLPEIFFDLAGRKVSQVRYHYIDCITHLFVDSFARQIGAWCERVGCLHTGHVLAEERPLRQTTGGVGSPMRFYEYMQAPGMDILTEHRREYDTAKQVSSVARQFGRKWRLSETYGCTGWDFPFLAHKALGDWQVALGINLRCQHLYWYTMKAEAKRDFPASIAHQSPWWHLYPKVEDYFARIHAVMTRGVEVRDLLVVHPIESTWTLIDKDWRNGNAGVWDRSIARLRDALLTGHIDFDYGDEEILSRHGRVSTPGGPAVFSVAKAEYRAVLVPPMITIRTSTLDLLERFRAAGGTVIFAGAVADHVDALPSSAAADLAAKCRRAPAMGSRLIRAVERDCRRVSICDTQGKEIAPALYLLREDADFHYLFLCNSGHADRVVKNGVFADPSMIRDRRRGFPSVAVMVKGQCVGDALEVDPDTGTVYTVKTSRCSDGRVRIDTCLPELVSRLFLFPKKPGVMRYPRRSVLTERKVRTVARKELAIRLSEDNVLVLDRAEFAIGGGPLQPAEEILRIDSRIRDHLGIQRRGGRMVQPWASPAAKNPKRTPVRLVYRFSAECIPSGPLWLAVEEPRSFRLKLNGVLLDADLECGWWCDRSLCRLPVDPASICAGENTLELECEYPESHPGLEIIYLLGHFGVACRNDSFRLVRPPHALKIGDWGPQGLPFYSGAVTYLLPVKAVLKENERLFLRVPEFRGAALRIRARGRDAGIIAWPPYEADVTGLLDHGAAELEIELVSHRRNSHGPFHYVRKWPEWTGPTQYVSRDELWTDRMQLVPCGIMKAPELVVRKLG